MSGEVQTDEGNEWYVLWPSGDREVALKMVFMYTYNSKAKGWWDEVCLIVWGPSSRLLTEDKELQESLTRKTDAGVEVVACKACADSYGITKQLEEQGIEVIFMGQPLTHLLKQNVKLITF